LKFVLNAAVSQLAKNKMGWCGNEYAPEERRAGRRIFGCRYPDRMLSARHSACRGDLDCHHRRRLLLPEALRARADFLRRGRGAPALFLSSEAPPVPPKRGFVTPVFLSAVSAGKPAAIAHTRCIKKDRSLMPGGRMEAFMKVVVWKSPKFLRGFFRFIFGIKSEEE
jgi:hypothetical protein